jgi:hypothetical protein
MMSDSFVTRRLARSRSAFAIGELLFDGGDLCLAQVCKRCCLAWTWRLLLGVRERVRLLAGKLDIGGASGKGATVLVKIPLEKTDLVNSPN